MIGRIRERVKTMYERKTWYVFGKKTPQNRQGTKPDGADHCRNPQTW